MTASSAKDVFFSSDNEKEPCLLAAEEIQFSTHARLLKQSTWYRTFAIDCGPPTKLGQRVVFLNGQDLPFSQCRSFNWYQILSHIVCSCEMIKDCDMQYFYLQQMKRLWKKDEKHLWDRTYIEIELIFRKGLQISDIGKVSLLFQIPVSPICKIKIRLFPKLSR